MMKATRRTKNIAGPNKRARSALSCLLGSEPSKMVPHLSLNLSPFQIPGLNQANRIKQRGRMQTKTSAAIDK